MAKYTSIGGQALIEGILMRSPEKSAMAVRKADGSIETVMLSQKSLRDKYAVLRLPIIRGVVAFIESLIGGYKAMMQSADISGFTDIEEDSEKEKPAEETAETETIKEQQEIKAEETEKEETEKEEKEEKSNSAFMAFIMVLATVLGFGLAIVLFLLVPRLVVSLIEYLAKTKLSSVAHSAIEQAIKLAVLVIYMWAVSFMKDIKRVFMYHGAEHKTIFCYEAGLPLTVENVKKQRRFHPRCGTSFMILMILVSFIVSTVVQILFKGIYENAAVWVCVKLLMIPLICGLGFELLRVCGKYDNLFTKIVAAPGLWLQRITTKEPDSGMMEIAITALKACEPEIPDVDRSAVPEQTEESETNEQNDI